MIREYSRGYSIKDEVSEVLGDPRYIQNFYPPGLKERTVGPWSRDLVSVSRFYKWLTPPVVIDFEPSPYDAKFWLDEKRQWCSEHGIVYVPVMLTERLTGEQFRKKVDLEIEFHRSGRRDSLTVEALRAVTPEDVLRMIPLDRSVEDLLVHPVTVEWIDTETMRRFEEKYKDRPLHGGARIKVIGLLKAKVIAEVRERIKHGRVGHLRSDQQSPVPAGR